ncbi:hypothetical protein BHE74_00011674 [Ensete ventricosum]|nr:hypothetical protein BHE74_00011674 [Ensete ventricosum]
MQCSNILGYFHDFTEERTMMLKVFHDDDLGSKAHDGKKEQEKGIHLTPIAMMPSISMLALPKRGNVFILRADTSRVGISVTLMQDGPWHERGMFELLPPHCLDTSESNVRAPEEGISCFEEFAGKVSPVFL